MILIESRMQVLSEASCTVV